MTLRIGIIGTGAICKNRILPVLTSSPDWKVVAAHDPNPEALQSLSSLIGQDALCSDLDAFFVRKPEAVYIATPNNSHAPLALRAMEHGCDVLVEKPCADTLANGLDILTASQRAGHHVLVGYMSKFNRHNQRALELAAEGAIGRPLGMSSSFGFICSDPRGWRFSKAEAGLGVIGDLMTYQVATALDLFGETPLTCRAIAWPGRDPLLTDRTVMATLELPGGTRVQIDSSFDREACHYTIIGETGAIEVSGSWYQAGSGRLAVWNASGKREIEVENINPYAEEFAHFARVIRGEATAGPLSIGRAVADLRVLDAMARSAALGGSPTTNH